MKTFDNLAANEVAPSVEASYPWLIKNEKERWILQSDNDKLLKIDFRFLLPDGSYLSDPINENFLRPIKDVLIACRESDDYSTSKSNGQVTIANALFLITAWLVMRGFSNFASVTQADLNDYITQSAQGYEECFRTTERVFVAIKELKAELDPLMISLRLVFERAGIPHMHFTKAPRALRLFRKMCPEVGAKIGRGKRRSRLRRITVASLAHRKAAISMLWRYRNEISGGLTFEPFSSVNEQTLVHELGRAGGKTKTMPLPACYHLMQAAATWVTTLGPAILELNDQITSFSGEIDCEKKRVEAYESFYSRYEQELDGLRFGRARAGSRTTHLKRIIATYIPTACYCIILGLTGRRHIEIANLKTDAISGNAIDGWWIKTYIAKTLKRDDFTPCPELVVRAVELMIKIGGSERKGAGASKLFIVPRSGKGWSTNATLNINHFAKFVRVPPVIEDSQQKTWHFAPHQFRRIFAILFVWRFEYGNLGALSYQLRHFNMGMTLTYVRDGELQKILGEEFHRLTVSKLRSYVADEERPAGIYGKSLSKAIEKMRVQLEITDEKGLGRVLERLTSHKKMSLRPTQWGYCAATAMLSNIRRAACQGSDNVARGLNIDGMPDSSGSDEVICAHCLFHLTDSTRKHIWKSLENSLSASCQNVATPSVIRDALSERERVIRIFVAKSF